MDDKQKAELKKIIDQLDDLRSKLEDLEDNEDGTITEATTHLENCVDELNSLFPEED